jgi:hypothetical protein
MGYIDKDAIESIIDEVGADVEVYLPNYTVDDSGNAVMNYLSDPIKERALIRTRTDTTILNEQGLQTEGDALGYFKANSLIKPESEVHVVREEPAALGAKAVYYVISMQSSYFEGSLKFMKAVMQKRRF